MADGGSALGSMQRLLEERTQQASTAQQALMQLQQDHARLSLSLRHSSAASCSQACPPLLPLERAGLLLSTCKNL